MRELISKIQGFDKEVTYESMKNFIKAYDFSSLEYEREIPAPEEEGDYGRNILVLDPFECVLINWPPGVASAVHLHKGLFGYVLVLEGELDNFVYKQQNGILQEFNIDKYVKGGLMPEPDGTIHKIANTHKTKRAITLHFYHPALLTLENLKLYNLKNGSSAVLSKQAKTASWSNEPGHFKSTQQNDFAYRSYDELNKHKSHLISNVFPKPSKDVVGAMNGAYFSEQAHVYDEEDFEHEQRNKFTNAIDCLVAEDLKNYPVSNFLDIATGTGRRAINIRNLSNKEYEITGVDISEEMCKIAESRGLRTYHQDWENDDSHTGEIFDAASFLYAFGHTSHEEGRIKTLRKIHSYLKKGSPLYIDLFNINNQNEWGPLAAKAFDDKNLHEFGYQRGDVFYRKNGHEKIAFLHYFNKDEIVELLTSTGFKPDQIKMVGYTKKAGEIVGPEEGNFFIKAIRL